MSYNKYFFEMKADIITLKTRRGKPVDLTDRPGVAWDVLLTGSYFAIQLSYPFPQLLLRRRHALTERKDQSPKKH